jgi:ADP-heptose:LPS heptosyltransferase
MKDPHLLLIRFSALGDIAITVPVIRCIYKTYPHLKITFVSRPHVAPLFQEFENLNFFPTDFDGRHKGIKGLWILLQELKTIPFSSVADLHNVLRTYFLKVFFGLYGYKVKSVEKGRIQKRALTRVKNKKFQPLTPTIYRYADVFRKLGFPISFDQHEFPKKNELPLSLLSRYQTSEKKWIGIAPFAAHTGKMYPLDLMQQLINFLQKDYQIFLFGAGEKEKERTEVWEKAYTNVYSTVGKIKLKDQLDLMAYLDLMISMDSANGHLAANCGIKVLTLWGMTHPFCGFSPFNQPLDHALTLDRRLYPSIPTSVYGNRIPESYQDAFRSMDPKIVIEKILELLKQ